jgi:hypothetical protein
MNECLSASLTDRQIKRIKLAQSPALKITVLRRYQIIFMLHGNTFFIADCLHQVRSLEKSGLLGYDAAVWRKWFLAL